MKAVARFAVTAEDRDQTRGALLARLANRIDSAGSWELMEAVARFAVTAKERAQTRGALLTLLSDAPDPRRARMLENTVTGLSPTVADLGGSDSWPIPLTPALLAAARQNSALPTWLAGLPRLCRSAHIAANSDGILTPNNELSVPQFNHPSFIPAVAPSRRSAF